MSSPKMKIPPPCYPFLRCDLLEHGDGKAVVRIVPSEDMENPYGLVQGGILCGLLDNAIGPASWTAVPDRASTTIQMDVRYLRPVRPGDVVLARAEVVSRSTRFLHIDATLERERDGKILTRASAINALLGPAHEDGSPFTGDREQRGD